MAETSSCKGKKILVFAPHADDEVLGCGGYLMHQIVKGADVLVCIATIGREDCPAEYHVRNLECFDVMNRLRARGMVLYKDMDGKLDHIPTNEFVGKIEQVIDEFKPDELFVCYPSHHQDHAKLHDCVMKALRLRNGGHTPRLVALYEYPFINNDVPGCKCYHDIEDVIEAKCDLFCCYESQIKEPPSPLNAEGIKALARYRGMQSGHKYAELFYVTNMILK